MKIRPLLIPLALLLAASPLAAKIPVETLFRKPEFQSFQVSPNGEYLAVLAPYERRANIHVIELATMNITRLTNIRNTDIASYFWANDDRLVFRMDNGGDEIYGMFAIDRDGSNPTTIVPLLETRDDNFRVRRYTEVIDLLKDQKDYVLVMNNDRRSDFPDVYLLDVNTGRRKIHLTNPGNVIGWLTDQNGQVRIGSTRDLSRSDAISYGLIYRDSEQDEFRQILPYVEDEPRISPLVFDHDGETVYVSARLPGQSTSGLYPFDPNTGELGELIYRDEIYDAGGVLISDFTKKLAGYSIDKEKTEFVWLDEEKAQIQEAIDQAFPDTINVPSSMSDDETMIVFTSFSDRHPASYNLLSLRDGTLKLTPLGQARQWIQPEQMSEQEPFVLKARDGLDLRGYISFPVGAKRENLPLIVNPHGGPNARDLLGWDPRVQFFTSRGFAVLQVNFRGSSGYGYEFLKAGHQKWGEEMQWDVRDAVQWAIDQGYANPQKIGIYGGSYGGYATMAQLVQYPELYQFGINVVGVVDLEKMLKYERSRSETSFAFWQSRIGNLSEDIDRIRDQSPVNHLDKLDDPVFIIHGRRDPRVPIEQAETLRAAMRKAKKDFEWLVKADEGHGFRKEENVFLEFNRIEGFIRPFMKKWGMDASR